MARERKGSIVNRDGKLFARIQFTDENGKRRNITRKAESRTRARQIIRLLLKEADGRGLLLLLSQLAQNFSFQSLAFRIECAAVLLVGARPCRSEKPETSYMAKCTKCGKKAGFMLSICDSCMQPVYDEYLTTEASSPQASADGAPPIATGSTGVAGWLWFLCFLLVFVNPIVTLIGITKDLQCIRGGWLVCGIFISKSFLVKEIILSSAVTVFGLYVGYTLVARTDKKVIKIAKVYLLIVLVVKPAILVLFFLEYRYNRTLSAITTPYVVGFIGSVIIIFAWFTYLSNSRRVKRRYVH